MNAYIITETNWDTDTTDIVDVYLDSAAALKAMKRMAGSHEQRQNEEEEFPWYESDDFILELQVHPIK